MVLLALKGVNRLIKIKKFLINLISFKEPEKKQPFILKETPEESQVIEKEEKQNKKEDAADRKSEGILKKLVGPKNNKENDK